MCVCVVFESTVPQQWRVAQRRLPKPSTRPNAPPAPRAQVDGEWRLANGWPMELDDSGNEVNVLTVE